EDVETRTGDPSLAERLDESALIDDGSPRRIHEIRGRLHQPQLPLPERVARAVAQEEVDGDEVRSLEELILRDQGRAGLLRPLPRRVGAPREPLHPERSSISGPLDAELSQADDPGGRPLEVPPERVLPAAPPHRGVLLRDRSSESQDQTPR